MIYLKIISQVLTGVAGLVALLLDYKWHDKRRKIFKVLRNCSIILTILSLIAGVIVTLVDERGKTDEISSLKADLDSAQTTLDYIKSNSDSVRDQMKPFLELAASRYPNLKSSDALQKLKSRLDSVDSQLSTEKRRISSLSSTLDIEKKTIKTFDVSVYIEFSGKWTGQPYPTWYQPGSPQTYLKWSDSSKRNPDIEFKSSRITYKTINSGTGAFESILTVQPGTFPSGELIDVLSEYNRMSCWLIFTEPKTLTDPYVEINKVRIKFLINGSKRGELISDEKLVVDLSALLSKANENSILNPTLTLDGKLIDLLKISL